MGEDMAEEFLALMDGVHARLRVMWPNGREAECCENDGSHFALLEHSRPVSLGQVEARLMYNLVVRMNAMRVFEVGTGFGYSSFWLGAAVKRLHGSSGWVGSIDNQSEGSVGADAQLFAVENASRLGLAETNHYFLGTSPRDIERFLSGTVNIAFIDGNHRDSQPSEDYIGLRPFLEVSSALVWHDVQSQYDVCDGISMAIRDGWSPVVFPTSCRLCVCYKDYAVWEAALHSFSTAAALRLF